ncbi:MAG: GGDEF domain-containing protein, partial [Pseudomonadota bacterium]|nr:GGDEF domain-containing protein [Pseudomonadota bacterium]
LGGEEFVILLPHAPIEAAYEVAERLRLAFRDLHIETHKGPLFLTVSIGIAQCLQKDIGIEATLSRADKALYLAKESGRNQAIAASTDEAE